MTKLCTKPRYSFNAILEPQFQFNAILDPQFPFTQTLSLVSRTANSVPRFSHCKLRTSFLAMQTPYLVSRTANFLTLPHKLSTHNMFFTLYQCLLISYSVVWLAKPWSATSGRVDNYNYRQNGLLWCSCYFCSHQIILKHSKLCKDAQGNWQFTLTI